MVLGVKLGVLCYSYVREKVLLMFQNSFVLWRMCPVNASIAFFIFVSPIFSLGSSCAKAMFGPFVALYALNLLSYVGSDKKSTGPWASHLILNVSNHDWIPKGPPYLCGYGYLKNNFQRHHPIATDCKEFLFIRC